MKKKRFRKTKSHDDNLQSCNPNPCNLTPEIKLLTTDYHITCLWVGRWINEWEKKEREGGKGGEREREKEGRKERKKKRKGKEERQGGREESR
jgi:hypothetical protein